MIQFAQTVNFPVPTNVMLIVLAVAFGSLLIVAVLIDSRRRSGLQRTRSAVEWKSIEDILSSRDLAEEEKKLIEAVIRRHAAAHPLKAITVRQDFEACIDAEMSRVEKSGDRKAFERMGAILRDIRCHLRLDYAPVGQRITSSRDLMAGQWMSVSRDGSTKEPWFRMMAESIDEAYLYMSRHGKEATPTFREGDRLRCRLWRDEDARYVFTTEVAVFDDPPPAWRFKHVDNLNRVQAREHFRVRFDQTTMIGVLNAPVDGNLENLSQRRVVTKFRGRITSLSAGGCALVIPQPVSKRVLLRVAIEIPGSDPVEAEASVVASTPISGGRHLVRTYFVALEDVLREKIVKFILRRQQHLIKERGDQ